MWRGEEWERNRRRDCDKKSGVEKLLGQIICVARGPEKGEEEEEDATERKFTQHTFDKAITALHDGFSKLPPNWNLLILAIFCAKFFLVVHTLPLVKCGGSTDQLQHFFPKGPLFVTRSRLY